MSEGAALEEYDNCYLLRVPPEQKPIFSYNRFHGEIMPISDKGETLNRQWRRQGRFGRELATYADYLRRSGRPGTAIFADPQMRALKNFIRFNDLEDWEKNYEKVWRLQREQEHHWSGNRFLDLDFPDFFAANPELIKRNIGLEPKEFEKRTP
ncbi:hypothetical protein SDC9_165900 [bioreactor metagenome]|uniref:Uncharacterized protein n=1 Tax=bioreactor metagenome TaxID=1076179 RepID=A0A645FY25_9ZZZZ